MLKSHIELEEKSKNNSPDLLDFVKNNELTLSYEGYYKDSILHLAAKNDNYDLVIYLLGELSKAAINKLNKNGITAFHRAMIDASLKTFKLFLDNDKVDHKKVKKDQNTPFESLNMSFEIPRDYEEKFELYTRKYPTDRLDDIFVSSSGTKAKYAYYYIFDTNREKII